MEPEARPSGWRTSLVFLGVGGAAFLVDFATFNLLVFGLDGDGVLFDRPVTAKAIAIGVATLFAYLGNRMLTFGDRERGSVLRETVYFVVVNALAALLQLGCLAFSRYVLGLSGPVADNISGTLIGQAVAMAFRFVAYDRVVFADPDRKRVS